MNTLRILIVTTLLIAIACSGEPLNGNARVVSIARNLVVLEVTGPPGSFVELDMRRTPIGESGVAQVRVDLTHYSSGFGQLNLHFVREGLLGDDHDNVTVELPMNFDAIKALPGPGVHVFANTSTDTTTSVATATSVTGQHTIGADEAGRALLKLIIPGASAATVNGAAITVDPVSGLTTTAVDILPLLLASPNVSGGPLRIPATYTMVGGGPTQATIDLNMDARQVTRILDRWVDSGAPAAPLPTPPAKAILWRRTSKIQGDRYAVVGTSSTIGARYLATETTTEPERVRSCVYFTIFKASRIVTVRDITTGQQVTQKTFPIDRRLRCPEVVFSNQTDQTYYETNENIEQWLTGELSKIGA